ncbi:MAG: prepilin-type N-terminal cleavage/methylation domain-containing protein [bacterium]|nr:prepilin-type N-terminal cleavage/methylation domain-containing protein [bacterium]
MQNNNSKFKISLTLRRYFSLFAFRFKFICGFSLVELLVSISIFTIVTGIVLANFPSFSSKIALENLGHEIALTVRQAQVFGVASREFGVGSNIFPSHGVRFDSAQNTTFFLYADTDKNKKYTGTPELLETFTIRGGNHISKICGFITPSSNCTELQVLDVVFTRPDPEPTITGKIEGGEAAYSYVTVTVESRRGATSVVTVWSNGQIAIR